MSAIQPAPDAALTNRGVSLQQLKVANLVAYVLCVAMNGLAASGKLSKYKVGEVSDMYPTKITPASGAFSIWSLIYTLEALFVVLPLIGSGSQPSSASEDAVLLHGVGFWFLLACLCNALWLIVFVQGTKASTWISTVLIAMLLFSLCKIYINAELWVRRHPGRLWQRFVRTLILDIHFSAYAGWVTVATIVNISAALSRCALCVLLCVHCVCCCVCCCVCTVRTVCAPTNPLRPVQHRLDGRSPDGHCMDCNNADCSGGAQLLHRHFQERLRMGLDFDLGFCVDRCSEQRKR